MTCLAAAGRPRCSGASAAGGAAPRPVRARRSLSRSPRCRPGCVPRPGCGRRWPEVPAEGLTGAGVDAGFGRTARIAPIDPARLPPLTSIDWVKRRHNPEVGIMPSGRDPRLSTTPAVPGRSESPRRPGPMSDDGRPSGRHRRASTRLRGGTGRHRRRSQPRRGSGSLSASPSGRTITRQPGGEVALPTMVGVGCSKSTDGSVPLRRASALRYRLVPASTLEMNIDSVHARPAGGPVQCLDMEVGHATATHSRGAAEGRAA